MKGDGCAPWSIHSIAIFNALKEPSSGYSMVETRFDLVG